ncbi:MAG TPA: cytochrome c biogenesis protein CcsA [Phycisphaerales bacterium]|mgnify:CR=1 FL=1|nr:cytochrome c biogenesis protein CcsA [Phycisphaerales bacterium]HMP36722.1 cytochrome c biogenesis protein CcsA [Phycisphaerales bacterium]
MNERSQIEVGTSDGTGIGGSARATGDGTPSLLRRWWLPALAALVAIGLSAWFGATRGLRGGAGGAEGFAAQLDMRPLGNIAVHGDGRLRSYDSFANTLMAFVSGHRRIAGQSPGFTYLDMMLRPEAYEDADVIYVKNRQVRAQIADALRAAAARDPAEMAEIDVRMDAFMNSGLISERLVRSPVLVPLMDTLSADLIRTQKSVEAINTAMAVKRPQLLLSRLRIIPPPDGDPERRWHGIEEAIPVRGADGALQMLPIAGMDAATQRTIASHWTDLVNGWLRQDARSVNSAMAGLAAQLPAVNPEVYPSQGRLALESWYFAVDNMSWVWLVYMACVIPLLMYAAYRWPTALRLGLALFVAAFILQTSATGIRWYISGRWPNSNMFEAVTTASWFGACAGVLLEIMLRNSAMRGLFALAAAVSSMVALMAAHFLPAYLNPNIANMMPVLHDVWLYIHTNVIIFAYVLIFMAAVSAALYLGWRVLGGPPDYARVGGAGSLIVPGRSALALDRGVVAMSGGAAVLGGPPGMAGLPADPSPAAGVSAGTAALRADRRASPGEVFDGVTMVLMEFSFILLWAGIVMGAIWADHSWGRPWGWDPKEVFALNTFLVFALLIHVRLKAKDKGLWTALLAILGAGVMLFNWIVINFVIAGLHSYA